MNEHNGSLFEIEFGKNAMCVLMFQRREDGSLGVFGFKDATDGKLWSVREVDQTLADQMAAPLKTDIVKEVSGMEATGGALVVINRNNFEQTMVEMRELLSNLLAEQGSATIATENL